MIAPGPGDRLVEIPTAKIWLRADGIAVFQIKPGVRETLASAQRTADVSRDLTGDTPHPYLVDLRAPFSMDAGVREFYARHTKATAIGLLVGSGLSRIVGNLFLTVNAPAVPTRMFTDEDQAIAWLRVFAPR